MERLEMIVIHVHVHECTDAYGLISRKGETLIKSRPPSLTSLSLPPSLSPPLPSLSFRLVGMYLMISTSQISTCVWMYSTHILLRHTTTVTLKYHGAH